MPLILEAIKKVVSEWKSLGLMLGLKEEEDLRAIEYNRRHQVQNKVQDCREDMIYLWIRTGTATIGKLIEALEAEKIQNVADELKQQYNV